MSRRSIYSKVNKTNKIRAKHVQGMGDVMFKGFQCLNPDCTEFIYVRESDITEEFSVKCPKCGYTLTYDGETKFYDYSMDVMQDDGTYKSISNGSFSIFHDEYVNEAAQYKYCIICNTLKPIDFFDRHSSRNTGRQGECQLCKRNYNAIKNGTRTTDQHREAAQKRRLLIDVAGNPKINSAEIENRYKHHCFNCNKDLNYITSGVEKPLDHTLPVYYLWPLNTENATLLCRKCNGEKSGAWPSDFYSDEKLKKLAVLTGIDYNLLAGAPRYNPEALNNLRDSANVDNLLAKYSAYMNELCKLRNRILKDTGLDFFQSSTTISKEWIKKADSMI